MTIVDPSPVEGSKKIAEQSPDNGKTTSEKLPSVSSSHDTVINSDEDQGHHQKSNKKIDAQEVSGPPKGSPVSDEQTVSSEQSENVNKPSTLSASQQGNPEKMDVVDSLPKEEIVSLTADEKAEGEKPVESAAAAAAANEEKSPAPSSAEPTSDSTQANSEAVATKDTSTSKVTTDDEIGVAVEKGPEDNKPVNNEEKMQDSQITATTPVADEEPSVPAAANKDKSEGTTNNKSVGSKETVNSVESKSEAGNKNKATSADQSISKTEEKESQDSVPAKIDEQVEEKKSSKPVSADEDVKPEPSSKTDDNEDENNQMAPTKTDLIKSDLFEEDRSFKGSLEEFSQFGGKWDQMELSPDRDLDSFNSPEDDLMNESIRAERDDKKTEEKKKKDREEEKEMKEKMSEKEKILGKPFPKTEAKLTKKPIVHSNDPVDEYEITSRKKRSQDAAAGDISKVSIYYCTMTKHLKISFSRNKRKKF